MMQMRWLTKTADGGVTRVLQYRQQYDATIRAHSPNLITWPHEPTPIMQWGDWIDVPEVTE